MSMNMGLLSECKGGAVCSPMANGNHSVPGFEALYGA